MNSLPFHANRKWLFGVADYRARAGIVQGQLEHPVVPESKEVFKKVMCSHIRRTKEPIKRSTQWPNLGHRSKNKFFK